MSKVLVTGAAGFIGSHIVEHLLRRGDVNTLAESIQRLVNDERLVDKRGRAARAKMETEFSPERHCDKLMEVFQHVSEGERRQ